MLFNRFLLLPILPLSSVCLRVTNVCKKPFKRDHSLKIVLYSLADTLKCNIILTLTEQKRRPDIKYTQKITDQGSRKKLLKQLFQSLQTGNVGLAAKTFITILGGHLLQNTAERILLTQFANSNKIYLC